ncbi:pseudaminic acid cytidylyltransferase [Pseudomonas mosselii]|uniref:pseudaminic acid cytidylyltransferase n=1 Tax=Pseudomonas mosselii TaxID=78327 RepID=UPI000BB51AD6|nr:pseudaminic acid cytidylyltransferase [Pseudomonas mosselii]ATB64107.1 pseudaminic acid cytidylyltransferase [Pseudomonas mosselii]MBC3451289.1 pseudaminic acid cytidylyltransferase [Pseudomonas mosselii]MDH1099559.1 pseudaminic acid cytidylyltransferase [Pseudomonas mosselii]MEB5934081.1 pseudaminic acid cytidylyltransferase [Pseudomonas mosselii]
MNVAIIPARGGSKRIPRKNIKVFCGKPMIAYSIEAALASGCFEKVVVSTDDSEIAALAREYGASVPFLRPGALSDDYTGTVPVIRHAIEQLSAEGKVPVYVCCIYATAPFVNAADIKRGLALMADAAVDYAFSVASYPFPIQRAVRVTAQNRIEMFQPEHLGTRSQDLEEAFHDAGQFYWGRTSAWLEGRPIFGPCSVPVVMPRHRVQDIDTLEDWIRAEWLFKAMQAGN